MLLSSALTLSACGAPDPQADPSLLLTSEAALAQAGASLLSEHVARERGPAAARGLEVAATRQHADEEGILHTRYQQLHRGVPVFGGEAIVHTRANGEKFGITDSLVTGLKVDTRPSVAAERAVERAVERLGCRDCLTAEPQSELVVLAREGQEHLTWKVQLRREDGTEHTSMPVTFVDAHTGEVVWAYDNLQTGSGPSLYSGTVSIGTLLYSSTYYMENTSRKIGTFDMRNGTSSVYRFTDTNDTWDATAQRAGVDAHFGAEKVWNYFYSTHGRNGIDGAGGPGYYTSANGTTKLISSRVHYGSKYNNAYWNGEYMTYGDGDGTTFSPLVSVDICGHEMTHGIIQFTANLTYSGESGALNEGIADIFGAMLDRYVYGDGSWVWTIGEDVYTPGTSGDALRYMDNPHKAKNSGYTADDDPCHYAERYTGTGDNGGVHINSGIANKAFYLLAKGGTHHKGGSMTGIGADKAAAIWYRALTSYMTSSTNFKGARTATLNAAAALYGSSSAEYTAVANSWKLVGVL